MIELNDVNPNSSHLGHLAGEELQKILGAIIKASIRDVDLGARYKERQFALVLVNTNEIGAEIVVQCLKDLIITQFSENSDKMPAKSPTFNIGFAVYPSGADSIDLLIQQAEKGLIASKNHTHPPVPEGS